MKKILIVRVLVASMAISTMANIMPNSTTITYASEQKVAKRNEVNISCEGTTTKVVAYNIDGYNYFRIADICKILNMKLNPINIDGKPTFEIRPSDQFTGDVEQAPEQNEVNITLNDYYGTYFFNGINMKGFNFADRTWYKLSDVVKLTEETYAMMGGMGDKVDPEFDKCPKLSTTYDSKTKTISITVTQYKAN